MQFLKSHFLSSAWIFLVSFLCAIGVFFQYSASGGYFDNLAVYQNSLMMIFLPISISIAFVNIEFVYKSSVYIYIVSILLLIWVHFYGSNQLGATRWIRIYKFNLQPSELSKIATILMLSRYFSLINLNDIRRIYYLIMPCIIFAMPTILILKQPNLGTAIILSMICAAIFFSSGVKYWKFLIIIFTIIISAPFIWKFVLHDYQKQRVITFISPHDTFGAEYNILQSKIAIGSGRMMGKGFVKGTQNILTFVPKKRTDFIFSVIMEERGFFGGMMLISIYTGIIILCTYCSIKSKDHFCKNIAIGSAMLFFSHVFINIGMVIGALPVVGVPLPLISHGGSNLLSSMIIIGLMLNITFNIDKNPQLTN